MVKYNFSEKKKKALISKFNKVIKSGYKAKWSEKKKDWVRGSKLPY